MSGCLFVAAHDLIINIMIEKMIFILVGVRLKWRMVGL